MSYSPQYTITNKLLSLVGTVDAAREIITTAPLVPAWERNFQNQAKIRTIHHGTHLEGNNLNLGEVEDLLAPNSNPTIGKDRDIQEIINYRAVMDYLDTLPPITEATLKHIHQLTTNTLLPATESGNYRNVRVVIRNTTTGEVTHRPPTPTEIPLLMSEFFVWLHTVNNDIHPLLLAGIVHYELVRIHPFTDGNGRSTRALALLLLHQAGYEMKKFFSLDEYYDSDPQAYYEALGSVTITNDLTSWLEYFVLGISIEFNRIKAQVQKLSLDLHLKSNIGGKQIALSDRQIKLIEYLEKFHHITMKDAKDILPYVSEDTILRDFRSLLEFKLITRSGNTKGAKYSLKN